MVGARTGWLDLVFLIPYSNYYALASSVRWKVGGRRSLGLEEGTEGVRLAWEVGHIYRADLVGLCPSECASQTLPHLFSSLSGCGIGSEVPRGLRCVALRARVAEDIYGKDWTYGGRRVMAQDLCVDLQSSQFLSSDSKRYDCRSVKSTQSQSRVNTPKPQCKQQATSITTTPSSCSPHSHPPPRSVGQNAKSPTTPSQRPHSPQPAFAPDGDDPGSSTDQRATFPAFGELKSGLPRRRESTQRQKNKHQHQHQHSKAPHSHLVVLSLRAHLPKRQFLFEFDIV